MTVYERIESLRKKYGISQGNLEKELGFSNGSISKWKNSMPTPERLKKLADFFHVSVEYLISGETTKNGEIYYLNNETRDIAQAIYENQELHMLFNAARDSSPEDLMTVYTMLLALKRKEHGNINKK